METRPVYYDDPYLRELDTAVVSVKTEGKGFAVETEATIFYPECGGQPGDCGKIANGTACETVVDTKKGDGGTILHIISGKTVLKSGDKVKLILDWPHRFHYMVEHTAQHLISGTAYNSFGIGTVSVHMGEEFIAIESDKSEIPEETLLKLEDKVNEHIRSGAKVNYLQMSHADAEARGLRRTLKVEGDVRLVQIEGIDEIGCGGVHVSDIGQLKAITFAGTEKIRGHIRTFWRAGDRAVANIRADREIVRILTEKLSAAGEELIPAFEKNEEIAFAVKGKALALEKELARTILKGCKSVIDISESALTLKAAAEACEELDNVSLCFVKEEGGKLLWMVVSKGNGVPFDTVRSELLPLINAKGGGRAPVWQGAGEVAGKAAFLKKAQEMFTKE